jgi:hypothetical protein
VIVRAQSVAEELKISALSCSNALASAETDRTFLLVVFLIFPAQPRTRQTQLRQSGNMRNVTSGEAATSPRHPNWFRFRWRWNEPGVQRLSELGKL